MLLRFFNTAIYWSRKGHQAKATLAYGGMYESTEPFGFSFQFCKISADHDLLPVVKYSQTYLGRPWKDYSKTILWRLI
jgi:pectinesterase